jgi:hypothetical protein
LRLARSLSAPAGGPSSAFCDDGMPQRIMQSSRCRLGWRPPAPDSRGRCRQRRQIAGRILQRAGERDDRRLPLGLAVEIANSDLIYEADCGSQPSANRRHLAFTASIARLMPARLDDRAPRFDFRLEKPARALGVEPSTTTPSRSYLARTSGSARALTVAALTL